MLMFSLNSREEEALFSIFQACFNKSCVLSVIISSVHQFQLHMTSDDQTLSKNASHECTPSEEEGPL